MEKEKRIDARDYLKELWEEAVRENIATPLSRNLFKKKKRNKSMKQKGKKNCRHAKRRRRR